MESKQIFSIRKFKTGTHSALLGKFGVTLATSVALMTAGGVVHAEQVTGTNTAPTTTQVAPATSTPTAEIPTSVPAGTSQPVAEKTINSAQDTLKDNVASAEKSGVEVTTGETTDVTLNDGNVVDKSNEVLTDLSNQDKAVAEAKAKQEANQKAYTDAKTSRDTAVSEGQSDLSHSEQGVDDQVAVAKKNGIEVTTDTKDLTPKYVDTKGLTGSDLTTAMAKNIALYNQAVKDGVGIMDTSTAQMKKQIADYLLALSNYQKGIASNTGLQWQNGVVLIGLPGATHMSGTENVVDFGDGTIKTASMYATQGNNLDQNTDANFDNIFKIDGTGSILVKNTTNGDVKLTFSEINSPYNTGTYVAIWGDDKGGIAWSVFALYNGSGQGGAGEGAGGNASTSGRILNYVKSYKATAETIKGVSVVTFNDIDNQQTVKMSGLDGAKITTGKNISQTGNDFVAGSGDVSQGSAGELGSNGIKWNFSSADTREFSFTHSTAGKNTSIVGGIFGSASNVPQKPVAPKLTAHKATVTAPIAPTVPANQKVTVHYYKVTTTPTPEKPQTSHTPTNYTPAPKTPVAQASVGLPTTGDKAEGSIVQMALGALMVSFVGFTALKGRKEEN
ncbi:YSIRK-type signal peptide-containing protein [Streptococcus agalactiae]|uniref:YSIRK-type signal peptide-containing protein n=1 Tax=Streptococcus agalactiae TaxID=1311 RepID=UPI0021D5FFBB|nr:YSIRK-type signal peptide-containing protein [Streptococcus agalactiae]MCU7657252.1 YSIRK-type signal peptide-containing protein [Streptococcus agalactiae]MCU7679539.1 YSIRK-type signal peptide-containing protein [Streptococcus agalactiae]MCU7682168.1 YSIRK-type signal peptide-containing protein [Streptococcus agalactiae]